MTQSKYYSTMFVIFLLYGCSSMRMPSEQKTPVVLDTPFIETPEPTSLSSSTLPIASTSNEQNCTIVDIISAPPSQLSGFLLVDPEDGLLGAGAENVVYAIDFEKNEKIPIPNRENAIRFNLNTYTISPDRNWFIYFKETANRKNTLYLSTITGNDREAAYWDSDWGEYATWLNKDEIFILPSSDRESALLLNPFTGKWEKLRPEFPSGLNFAFPFYYYSPTLSSVVYVSGDNYILWDAKLNTDIWIKPTLSPYFSPKWSPDGSQVAMIIKDEEGVSSDLYNKLIIMSPTGVEIDISDFLYNLPVENVIRVTTFEWSPNGNYIAFLLEASNSVDVSGYSSLLILDILGKHVVNYCLPIATKSNLVWSPNSEYIAIQTSNQNEPEGAYPVILDPIRGWVLQIAENGQPVGWMK